MPAEVVAASPLRGRLVLLLGPEPATRRVGRAMAADPTVRFAEVPTDLFERGLARIVGSYLSSLEPGPGEGTGLVALFDPPALLAELRRLGDELLDEVRQGAETLVDHGPGLARWTELVSLLYPDAELVEVAPGHLGRRALDRFAAAARREPPRAVPLATTMPPPVADERLVLVVGANRSGTTWLQQLLLAHPGVAGVERTETWLFVALRGLWDNVTDPAGRGLGAYFTPARGAAIVRRFCDAALDRLAGGAAPDRVLERTPNHSMHLPFIAALYPGAWVIHVVRDGRDVVQSLLELDFVDLDARSAAHEWRTAVETVARDLPRFEHARDVRYEALLADPEGVVEDLLRWLGLEVGDEVRRALRERAGERVSRFNTTGEVGAGKWQRLDRDALAAIDAEAGPLLRSLGYVKGSLV